MCTPTGGVQPTVGKGTAVSVPYNLKNTNNYKVNVTVWVVYKGEVVSNENTHVIEAGDNLGTAMVAINHWAGDKDGFNPAYLSLKISVSKCE